MSLFGSSLTGSSSTGSSFLGSSLTGSSLTGSSLFNGVSGQSANNNVTNSGMAGSSNVAPTSNTTQQSSQGTNPSTQSTHTVTRPRLSPGDTIVRELDTNAVYKRHENINHIPVSIVGWDISESEQSKQSTLSSNHFNNSRLSSSNIYTSSFGDKLHSMSHVPRTMRFNSTNRPHNATSRDFINAGLQSAVRAAGEKSEASVITSPNVYRQNHHRIAQSSLTQSSAVRSAADGMVSKHRHALDLSTVGSNQFASPSHSFIDSAYKKKYTNIASSPSRLQQSKPNESLQYSVSENESGWRIIIDGNFDLETSCPSEYVRICGEWPGQQLLTWVMVSKSTTMGGLKQYLLASFIRSIISNTKIKNATIFELIEDLDMVRAIELMLEDGEVLRKDDKNATISSLNLVDKSCIQVLQDLEQTKKLLEQLQHPVQANETQYTYQASPSRSTYRRTMSRSRARDYLMSHLARDLVKRVAAEHFVSNILADDAYDQDEYTDESDIEYAVNYKKAKAKAAMPILPLFEDGYITDPPPEKLVRMSEDELSHVHQFCITRRGHGSILWIGDTDIRYLNLPQIVQIEAGNVEIYPSDTTECPPAGIGLNSCAQVRLFGVWPQGLEPGHDASTQALEEWQTDADKILGRQRVKLEMRSNFEKSKLQEFGETLKHCTRQMGGVFIGYDAETGSWTFQLSSFDPVDDGFSMMESRVVIE